MESVNGDQGSGLAKSFITPTALPLSFPSELSTAKCSQWPWSEPEQKSDSADEKNMTLRPQKQNSLAARRQLDGVGRVPMAVNTLPSSC